MLRAGKLLSSAAVILLLSSPSIAADTTSAASIHATTSTSAPVSSTVSCERYRHTGFWAVDIENYELPWYCDPPFSQHAIRDKSKLPYEAVGVAAAYVACALFLGGSLLTVGKKMRNNALSSNGTLEIEMVKSPKKGIFEPSPISPASSGRSWIRKLKFGSGGGQGSIKSGRTGGTSNPNSPGVASVNSFDNRVVQNDVESRQAEMERLYAAVRAHDAAKESGVTVEEVDYGESTAVPPSPKPIMRVNVEGAKQTSGGSQPTSPRSPIKAIYPPDHWPQGQQQGGGQPRNPVSPHTPMSPLVQQVQETDMYPPSPPPKSPPLMGLSTNGQQQHYHSPPSSPKRLQAIHRRPGSPGSVSIASSGSKGNRKSVRDLRISRPVAVDPGEIEERQPLTPKNYADPGAPPPVPEKVPYRGDTNTPKTTQTENSDDYAAEALDEPKPLPVAQPQRKPSNLSIPSSNGNSNGAKSLDSSTTALPFRAMGFASNDNSLTSPPATRTTYVETRRDMPRGPLTGRTPRTGVPMTPYSAYMPFTPLTPVTPRLITKADRKAMKKDIGKKVKTDDDLVKEEDEEWGSGY